MYLPKIYGIEKFGENNKIKEKPKKENHKIKEKPKKEKRIKKEKVTKKGKKSV